MGSLQEELKKQLEQLKLILPEQAPAAPLSPEQALAEQRKLAGIMDAPVKKEEEAK